MKLLLLTYQAPPDGGPVCRALCEAGEKAGLECVPLDLERLGSQGYRLAAEKRYRRIVESPGRTLGWWLKAAELLEKTYLRSPVYHASAGYAQGLAEELGAGGYDAVLCVDLYAMEAMKAVRAQEKNLPPCWGLLTEYFSVPFLRETELDGYFVPHEVIAAELRGRGVPEGKLIASGLPLESRLTGHISRAEARNYLVIPPGRRVYTVLVPTADSAAAICTALIREGPRDMAVYVPFQRGDPEGDEFRRRFRETPQVKPITHSDRGSLYLSASDAVIAVPYGPVCAELLCRGIPLTVLPAESGYGKRAVKFLSLHELALSASSAQDAARQAARLAEDPVLSGRMNAVQLRNARPLAAQIITETIIDHIKHRGLKP